MADGYDELTDKEKQTLRLMVRGHDAKSAASELSLSVHTINERLRAARRKLEVTSSREAARLVLEREAVVPQNPVARDLGDARSRPPREDSGATAGTSARRPIIAGIFIMLTFAATALFLVPSIIGADGSGGTVQTQPSDAEVESAARAWLEMVDARDWEASYAATAASFREANTLKLWSDTAQSVQSGLGAKLSREFVGQDDVPSPQGIVIVKFRTDFANRADALETISLVREGGTWKVAGIYVS
ncbi:helix-turn-helix domain-containing protein [Qipengyuania qiaonensis]|uniref:DUF4019 domain-containing protein n=1 Tax=Qipengyuania qiaonensis TaxID=2867240 RepID=A0ABS7J7C6_9SPHN|nr:DUF4019 domain-containing protein [Qipengyuania qiaonensis]MBX7481784.1 DUF4019 domain-containing protein [Qipengyuania qiaonensis]